MNTMNLVDALKTLPCDVSQIVIKGKWNAVLTVSISNDYPIPKGWVMVNQSTAASEQLPNTYRIKFVG